MQELYLLLLITVDTISRETSLDKRERERETLESDLVKSSYVDTLDLKQRRKEGGGYCLQEVILKGP